MPPVISHIIRRASLRAYVFEPADDIIRRASRRTNADPSDCFVSRHKFAHSRNVRQDIGAGCAGAAKACSFPVLMNSIGSARCSRSTPVTRSSIGVTSKACRTWRRHGRRPRRPELRWRMIRRDLDAWANRGGVEDNPGSSYLEQRLGVYPPAPLPVKPILQVSGPSRGWLSVWGSF